MGNEACDLDSTVSALALAYFLAQVRPVRWLGDKQGLGGRLTGRRPPPRRRPPRLPKPPSSRC